MTTHSVHVVKLPVDPQAEAEREANPKKTQPLETWDGALAHTREILNMVRHNWDKDHIVEPVTFLFVSASPETGEPLPETGIAILAQMGLMGSPQGKDVYSEAIKSMIAKTKAVGVVFVSEVWMTTGESREEQEALRAWMEKNESLENYPGRTECVFVTLEHAKAPHNITFTADIERPKEGKPILGEFKEYGDKSLKFSGRFAGLLHNMN